MLNRVNQRILTALLTTFLLFLADVTFHAVVYGFLPSATYQAVAAGVTSVGLSLPSIFTVTNSPVTSTGTLTGTFNSQTANQVFASPNGSSGAPVFRSSVAGDFGSQTANTVLAAPNGSAGTPSFRALATADLPTANIAFTNQSNDFTAGQQSSPCTLTNGSTIAVNAALSNFCNITLSASGQTMGCPSGVSSGNDLTLTLKIKQPASGGPDDLNWDPCYFFPNGTPPKQSNGGLSAANGVVDILNCDVYNNAGTVISYCPFNGSSNFASSAQFVLRNNHTCTDSNCSGTQTACNTTATTCAVTILNSMSGDLRTVEFSFYNGSTAAAPTSVTDGTNNCTIDSAAFNSGAVGVVSTGFAYCPRIVGSTSATVTVTWPASYTAAFVFIQEWVPSTTSPLAGIGNIGSSTGAANPSISTNGATTQTGQLVIAVWNQGDAPAANACTQIDKETATGHNLVQYSTSVSTCSLTATSSNYDASIDSFLHY